MKKSITQLAGTVVFIMALLVSFQSANAQGTSCSANFTYTSSAMGDTIFFTNLSTGSWAYSFWNFGDNTSSTANNPQHYYNVPGIYVVCLTVWDSVSCQSTYCDSILVGNPTGTCWVSFLPQVNGLSANFFQNISGTYTHFEWDFGDGTTSVSPNPFHTYSSPGVYTVCLTVYNNLNVCGSYCAGVTIQGPPTDTICGTIWFDTNGNGVQDPGENPVTGGVVYVYGNGIQ